MQNKILLAFVVLLVPIVVISFFDSKKTNFYLEEKPPLKIYLKDYDLDLDLNDYIVGVVSAEMPALFENEALKAQSVVARTFALYQMNHLGYVSLSDQAYLTKEEMINKWGNDYQLYYHKIKDIVASTNNEVIYYNNELIKSYYFAVSNGSTLSSLAVFNENLDYITPVDSSFDKLTSKYLSTTTINMNDFLNTLNIENITNIAVVKRDTFDVLRVTIDDKTYSGIEFRKLFNLKSASFDITVNNDVLITCYGYGHGVGMSQYGANELAKSNLSYQDIINYYYQNITIKNYVY